jgi:hypothetical protein
MEREDGDGGVDRDCLAEAASGAIGALVSTTVLYPLDTCKLKFQADVRTDQSAHMYRSAIPPLPSHSPFACIAGLIASRTTSIGRIR